MKVHKMHYTKALSLVKERRISVKLAQWVHNYLKMQQMKSDEKSSKPPMMATNFDSVGLQTTDTNTAVQDTKPQSFKEQLQQLIVQFDKEVNDKESLKKSIGIVQKMMKNIIDNPNDEKYRVVKQQNPKIKEALTKYYNGQ